MTVSVLKLQIFVLSNKDYNENEEYIAANSFAFNLLWSFWQRRSTV